MRRVRIIPARLRGLVVGVVLMIIAGGVLADLMITNAAGVRAGITGIVISPAKDINVLFAVRDPTGGRVTNFAIQRSSDLSNWTNICSLTVTGNYPIMGVGVAQVADRVTSAAQFYRMQLIDF